MFGNRFAYEYSGYGEEQGAPPWLRHRGHHTHHHGRHHGHGPFGQHRWGEGWTPPWLQQEWRGPQFFGMRRGRGPFGHGGPFGPGGEGGRFFGRGDIKFVLLELLQERPMHGYEMMKALEEKTGGFYTPSPGSIYPTLQMLEDGGMVTSAEVEGKRFTASQMPGVPRLWSGRALKRDSPGHPGCVGVVMVDVGRGRKCKH